MIRPHAFQKLFIFIMIVLVANTAFAFEWKNLWSTPEQRAKQHFDDGRFDELVSDAPSENWKGLGEYRNGDYAAASESFLQQRASAELADSSEEVEQAIYNQANALTQNSQFEDAINSYDELLSLNPEHANAAHNRDIAQQLLEQQQQQEQEQQQQQEQGDQGDQSEEGEEGEEGDQQNEQEQNSGNENQDSQSESQEGENQDQQSKDSSSANDQQDQKTADQQEQAEQDAEAAKAMEAEQARADAAEDLTQSLEGEPLEDGQANDANSQPLTEQEQANEQWLRQIPDDPAGLLQRKIQNRHLTDFPEVKDSANPW